MEVLHKNPVFYPSEKLANNFREILEQPSEELLEYLDAAKCFDEFDGLDDEPDDTYDAVNWIADQMTGYIIRCARTLWLENDYKLPCSLMLADGKFSDKQKEILADRLDLDKTRNMEMFFQELFDELYFSLSLKEWTISTCRAYAGNNKIFIEALNFKRFNV